MPHLTRQSVVIEAPYRITIQHEPPPSPAPGEVLVQTILSAISPGTEMLFYRGQVPGEMAVDETLTTLSSAAVQYPLRYGYACVGRVMALGSEVEPSWQDQLVFAFQPHSSHFTSPPAQLLPLPAGINPDQAAFYPNMETAVNFVLDGQPLIGERVLVIGQGVVGLLTTALLARFPLAALVTVEQLAQRRQFSTLVGAQHSVAPGELPQLRQSQSFDLVYELSGNPAALDLAIQHTRFSGRIVIGSWYGEKQVPIHLGGSFHRSRIRLISSQVSTIAPEQSGRWDKARRTQVAWSMLQSIDVTPWITHRFPIAQAAQAYQLIDQQPEQTLQVLLTYPSQR